MCAIAGIMGLPVEDQERFLKTMRHRGPDAQGIYEKEGCCLLHSRLTVIDPEGGVQPMTLSWAGEDYVLIYNGELYNTQALREELKQLGHRFLGHSDTEVVLHGYAQWGMDCVHRFNGIFAFAVWEENRKKLFLARDRIGVKPLFFMLHQGGLLFASEIKTILAYPTVKAELDAEGAAQLLMLGPGRLPGSGVFRNIQALEPGSCGIWERGKLEITRYWKLMDREHTEDFGETADRVRELVTEAIRMQMVSDVPIGTFLSGGLDSSLITAICAAEKDEPLDTFSVDYENNDLYFTPNKFQPNSDAHFIRLMQSALGTVQHWTLLRPEDLMAELENATVARDLPGMADVDFSLLSFCREIRPHVKVALSGECADEIFGGYPWYRDPEVRAEAGFPWAQNTLQRMQLLHPSVRGKLQPGELVQDAVADTCRNADILPGTSPEERRQREMMNLNFQWFMQTLLDRKDRMSMYCGLEVRVPFCDYRIAEYLYSVPWDFKNHLGREKGLLRYAMRGLLPDEILYRKKSPYPKTFDPRYSRMVNKRLKQLLEDGKSPLFGLVDREELVHMTETEMQWPWYGQLMRQPQTVAYFLQLDFWLRHYKVELLF